MMQSRTVRRMILISAFMLMSGCGGSSGNRNFFTSGSRQADQRADQRMARSNQLHGESNSSKSGNQNNRTLYDRLGGAAGVKTIVDDFVNRAMADPRVNWNRKGITIGGLFGHKSMEWKANPQEIATLKTHMAQFIALSSGGPSIYKGRDIHAVHKGMRITNTEFDAAIGDLKATLDKYGVANQDQKDLLAIMESTRAQIVEVK